MEPSIRKYHEEVLNLYKGGKNIDEIKDIVKVYSEEYINAIINNDYTDMYKEKDIDVYKTMHAQGYSLIEIAERTGYSLRYLTNVTNANNNIKNPVSDYSSMVPAILYQYFNCELYKIANEVSVIKSKTKASKGFIYRTINKFKASMGMIQIDNLNTIIDQYKSKIDILTIAENVYVGETTIRVAVVSYKLRLLQLLDGNLLLNRLETKICKTTPQIIISIENQCKKAGIDPSVVLNEFKIGEPIYDNIDVVIKNPIDDEENIKFSNGHFTKHHNYNDMDNDKLSDEELEELVAECDRAAAEEEWNDLLNSMKDEEELNEVATEKTFDDIIEEVDQEEEELDEIIPLIDESNNNVNASSLMMYGNDILKALYNAYIVSDEKNINLNIDVCNKSVIIKPDDSEIETITIKLK